MPGTRVCFADVEDPADVNFDGTLPAARCAGRWLWWGCPADVLVLGAGRWACAVLAAVCSVSRSAVAVCNVYRSVACSVQCLVLCWLQCAMFSVV